MTRRFTHLAWAATVATYLLIVFGAMVRITESGAGCGGDWPLCNGRLIPSLDDPETLIEWGHRLFTIVVAALVFGLAAYGWWLGRDPRASRDAAPQDGAATFVPRGQELGAGPRIGTAYLAAVLLVLQILLGAITVRLELPSWAAVLQLGTAMLILAALLTVATGQRPLAAPPAAAVALVLALATVLVGALTAKLDAGTACLGFPLCNGQLWPGGNYLQHTHWAHRLLAYGFAAYAGWWTWTTRSRGPAIVLLVVLAQVGVAAAMVLLDLPTAWRGAHVAVGTAAWAATVLAAR